MILDVFSDLIVMQFSCSSAFIVKTMWSVNQSIISNNPKGEQYKGIYINEHSRNMHIHKNTIRSTSIVLPQLSCREGEGVHLESTAVN